MCARTVPRLAALGPRTGPRCRRPRRDARSPPPLRRHAAALPPTDLTLPPEADVLDRYRSEVWPAVASRDVPSFREMLTRLRALEALRIARGEVLPVAARLLEHDVELLRRYLDSGPGRRSEAERSLGRGDRPAVERMVSEAQSQSGSACEPKPGSRELAERMLREGSKCSSACEQPGAAARPLIAPSGAPPAECERPGREVPDPGAEVTPPRLRLPPPTSTYDRALARVAGQLHHLTTVLEDLLRPRRRLHETAGFRSGNRLDPRRAMALEAEPRLRDKPQRRNSV